MKNKNLPRAPLRPPAGPTGLRTTFAHLPVPLRRAGRAILILAALFYAGPATLAAVAPATPPADGVWRILPVGDSITEGGDTFAEWRTPLWESLTGAGYFVRYVGSRSRGGRLGALKHEGHGGKNAEYIAERLATVAEQHPADVLLLHAGHNHSIEENPVPGIVAAQEAIIASCRAANPRVIVLLAQVIPSAKLPKYGYIPELNTALAGLASRLDTPASPVRIVDQASGFDPLADTIADRVHPNPQGATKMATRWFEALRAVLPPPAFPAPAPRLVDYKNTPRGPLRLHVFTPPAEAPPAPLAGRPAIVFFFGGGWFQGTPVQYYPECRHFAARGYVAISADYRVASTHRSSPFDAVADAKSALRYLRARATELGIDPDRIVAAGGSAGGHLAAATACLPGLDDLSDDLSINPRPSALVLWYGVIDNGPGGYGHDRIGARYPEFSPFYNVSPGFPPTLFFLGTADEHIPVATARAFQEKIRAAGSRCELMLFEGATHPVYNYRLPASATKRAECLEAADAFLDAVWAGTPTRRTKTLP